VGSESSWKRRNLKLEGLKATSPSASNLNYMRFYFHVANRLLGRTARIEGTQRRWVRRWVDDTCMVSTKFNNSYNASPYRRNTHLPALFDLLPFLTRNRARILKFVATARLGITTLGFIEIDDVPNGIEILADDRFSEQMGMMKRRAKDLHRPLH